MTDSTKEAPDTPIATETQSIEYLDTEAEKKVVWKCDLHVVPILSFLMCLGFLDRINIGNARLQGLERDLGMSGHDFNIALFIFFIPYMFFEVPSNIILKKVAPSTWLSGVMIGWGLVTVFQGLTDSFAGLLTCRIFLGIFEAGFFPGCVYLISMYYKRHELQTRVNFYIACSIMAGSMSGILAYFIAGMDGMCGYSGWRWIFILEGAATVVAAAVSKFFIPDWPETAKFLTEDERKILIHRLATETENSRMDRLDKPAMKRAFTDVKIYLGIIMYIGIVNSGYAVSFFTPTILHDLGWTALNAQLMAVPIFACGACSAMITAVISDRIRHRFTFTIIGCLIASVGYTILLCQQYVSVGVRYFAVFTISAGSFMSHPITITWLSNNMGGHYKRGISSAMQIGIGNSGGIIASNLFFPSEAPRYPTGYGASLGLIWLCALTCIVFLLYLHRENRLRAQGHRDHLLQLPEDEVNNLGDHHPSFKFTY
ncbi:hypothetical protein EMPG_15376 [Blastomyces silverae]|uniref:Major facilitator superfamily (MFS) profile domain-containing protein n=1 Tax=Blastomyces silverae TaxID=2060906 RepID=A0A0H1BJ51_9EURO|nr:hypothetical protein EMPG_15376 [Blastomyces silverae]